jgi:hypothetical protein
MLDTGCWILAARGIILTESGGPVRVDGAVLDT